MTPNEPYVLLSALKPAVETHMARADYHGRAGRPADKQVNQVGERCFDDSDRCHFAAKQVSSVNRLEARRAWCEPGGGERENAQQPHKE